MKKKYNIKENWYVYFLGILLLMQVLVFTLWGEHSFIAIHDNLDLFVAHNKMMKNQGIFFAQGAEAQMLGGITRDTLGSEFSLYNILYVLFSPYVAYVIGYFLKILIGFFGSILLAKDIYQERYQEHKTLIWLVAAGFAMIPVFPAYGIAFTSVPIVVYLLRRIYAEPKLLWYVCLFGYPLISYFSYLGFFILAYLVCAVLILWIKDKKIPFSLIIGLIVLATGYMTWEYRLFREMLFSDTITIRESMVNADVTFLQMMQSIGDVFVNTIFHAQDSHKYLILPITMCLLVAINLEYIRKKDWKKIGTEPCNLVFFVILFNCLVYGLYDFKPFRDLFEFLLPPLTGFQFNRTIFFNPFLWYVLFFLVLKWVWEKLQDKTGKHIVVYGIAIAGTLLCMFMPQVYNDFYSNCYHHAYELLKGKESSQLSFREFYSEELFDEIKKDLNYEGEWAAAYGMHPAVLQYNGIATLDGYLGLYSEEYKQQFHSLIAPALAQSEEFRIGFEDWGARAYLYSGAGENTYIATRELNLFDDKLYIDGDVFRQMEGTYIFSRIAISNAQELGLRLKGEYRNDTSPYTIYVYENI